MYSITETAKLNGLNPYYYLKYFLKELPKHIDGGGNIKTTELESLLPWADDLTFTIDGHVSMRERHGIKVSQKGAANVSLLCFQ